MRPKEYIVEDLQTGEQVDCFEAKNLIQATNLALMKVMEHQRFEFSTESSWVEDERSNMFISIKLPYGAKYVFEMREVGK